MALLDTFLNLTGQWQETFKQDRTLRMAQRQAIGAILPTDRKTMTAGLCALGRDQQDWSADYKFFSRSIWDPQELFVPILSRALDLLRDRQFIPMAYDDTGVKREGRKVPHRQCLRDPMSPAFHVNFIYGLRFAQGSILVPLKCEGTRLGTRALPVYFAHAKIVKKPGAKATEQEREAYLQNKKQINLSTHFVDYMKQMRFLCDQLGVADKPIVHVLDNSYCNSTCFGATLDRTILLARTRKDAKLCFRAPDGSNKRLVYDRQKFTPEQVRQDESIPYKQAKILVGGSYRPIRYKQVEQVLWQRGSKTTPIRLIVVAPTPYRTSPMSKTFYRSPAYLLCTDNKMSAEDLIQIYCDRIQIEYNHREEKSDMGIGQAQVWSQSSVTRRPIFVVACYSMLHLAALLLHGPKRIDLYGKLPAWRKNVQRPSCRDLLTLIRKEIRLGNERLRAINIDIPSIQKAS